MTDTTVKTPWHLWLVGLVALLFNAIGTVDYLMFQTQGPDYLASMGMSPEQAGFIENYPMWMLVVWPIGVWGAVLASVLLLLRKKLALPVFAVSLAAFAVSLIHTYVLTNGGEIMGASNAGISAVITALLLFFIWYARAMTKRGVLR